MKPKTRRRLILAAALLALPVATQVPPTRAWIGGLALSHGPAPLRAWGARAAADAGASAGPQLAAALADGSPEVKAAAAAGLAQMGQEAAPYAAELTLAMRDDDAALSKAIRELIASLGPAAAAPIAPLLAPERAISERQAAALALRELGADAAGARDALLAALKDREPSVRRLAADALARLPEPALAIPALLEAREGASDELKRVYAVALGQLILQPGYLESQGELRPGEAEIILPRLEAAFEGDVDEQVWAQMVASKIGFPAQPLLPQLLANARSKDAALRASALFAIERVAQPPPPERRAELLATAAAALKDKDPETRRTALRILAAPGLEDPPKTRLSLMLAALGDEDEGVRREAGASLAMLGAAGVDGILRAFEGAPDERRLRLAAALALMGPPLIPRLERALREGSQARRLGAGVTLALLGESGAAALMAALGEASQEVHEAALAGLMLSGRDALKPLLASLGGASPRDGRAILLVIASLGEDAAASVGALAERLEAGGEEDPLRVPVLATLRQLGQAGQLAAPQVRACLQSPDPLVRREAVDALAAVAPGQGETLEALAAAAEDEVDFVAQAAREALARLREAGS